MVLLFRCPLYAACVGSSPTWTTDGNEYADVLECYAVASPGDTINVIAGDGDATWATSLVINKNINIVGPGAANLRLRHTTPLDIFQVTGSVTSLRIGGFEFYTETAQRFLTIYNGDNWRIDHITYTNTKAAIGYLVMIWINPTWGDHSHGVIDSNTILNGKIAYGGAQTFAAARKLWFDDLNLGSAEAVYIENNVFTMNPSFRTNCVDSNRGSKYVFRYNSVHDTDTIMAHGLQEATGGSRKWEVYGNKFHAETHGTGTGSGLVATWMRGGTGVLFGNDYTSEKPYNSDISLDTPRDTGYDPPYTFTDNTTIDGRCDGDHNIDGNEAINGAYYGTGTLGTGSHDAVDGAILSDSTKAWVASRLINSVVYNLADTPAKCSVTANTTNTAECVLSGGTRDHWHTGDTYKISDGWPCRDGFGISKDATLATVWGDLTGNVQEKAPAYFWSNYRASVISTPYIGANNKKHIQADRDYFQYTTSFNGTSGMGCGTDAQMNAITPTVIGVGFWVPTDIGTMPCRPADANIGAEIETLTTPITGTLYKWSGSAWVAYYTPYQYPHPLRAEVESYSLSVTKTGTGSGLVTAIPVSINCGDTCSYSFLSGTEVTLTATIEGNNDFSGWSGTGGCTGKGSCVLTMSEAKEVTATFTDTTPVNYLVTISYAGTGFGTTDPAAGVYARASEYVATTTQTPIDLSTFAGWSGTCGCTGVDACAPTITADCSIIATWDDAVQYTLTVTYPSNGEVVSSDVGSIFCGSEYSVCSADYYSGTVTLTTTCADGWYGATYSGDCTGSTCAPTMSANKSVTVECYWKGGAIRGGGGIGGGGSVQ